MHYLPTYLHCPVEADPHLARNNAFPKHILLQTAQTSLGRLPLFLMLLLAILLACVAASPKCTMALPSVHRVQQLPGLAALAEAQFTGYLPTGVNDSAPLLFFWLMESRSIPDKDPLVIWLQGGPGCSGGLGLFWELGPYRVHQDKATLYKNADSWNSVANLLMIDQPAGTGFSSVLDNSSIPVTLAASTKQLHFALGSFLEAFPEYKGRGTGA
jgi:serine carboxypeptidase-like clade 2